MPSQANIQTKQDNTLEITGVVDFYSSPELLRRGRGYMKGRTAMAISFAGVERVDSSAAALMLEWWREAQKRNIELSFSDLPDMLVSLLSVCGLEGRLPVQS
jgi:phospholipid transport system transporter-binding protein